jgi:WD40 repeat protein
MTDAATPDAAVSEPGSRADTPRFPSLDAMRSVHGSMLKRKSEAAEDAGFQEQIVAFIHSAQATGAVLDSDRDRHSAQTLIDYWVTLLFRATRQDRPETVLDEFDPRLSAHELRDDQYPYGEPSLDDNNQGRLLLGTHRLVRQCIEQLEDRRLVAIVGPAGSGRSTLLRNGLLPALKQGEALGSAHWRYLPIIEPGSEPLKQLAEAFRPPDQDAAWVARQVERFQQDPGHLTQLIDRQGDQPTLLVVDRFEELFLLSCREQRDAFVDNLARASQSPPPATHCSVVLLMKAEYLARADALPGLKQLLQNSIVYVAFTADEIREAIEKPAAQIGLKFDEGLVDRLIQTVQGDPAALTLLQFTLRKLWDQRVKNRITWDAYNRVGAGRLALERCAESAYRELTEQQQAVARAVFLQLVRPDLTQDTICLPVRRRVLQAHRAAGDQVDLVIDRFLDVGLLKSLPGQSPDDEQIAMAHPALVGHWPRLVEWLSQERDRLRRRLRLREAATSWRNRDRDTGVLWRGSLLEEAERYTDLDDGEREFVDASRRAVDEAEQAKIAAAEREKLQAQALAAEQQQRAEVESRSRKRTQWAAALLAAALLAVIALAVSTYGQYRSAEAARQDAEAARLQAAQQSLNLTVTHGTQQLLQNGDRPGAALWFAGAMQESDPEVLADDVRDVLARGITANLRQQPALAHLLYQAPPEQASTEQASAPQQSDAHAADFLTYTAGFVEQLGKILVVNSHKDGDFGDARLFDRNGADQDGVVFRHADGPVRWATVSPDGRWLATAGSVQQQAGPADNQDGKTGVVRIWDVTQPNSPARELERMQGRVNHVAFGGPGGRYLVAGSGNPGSESGELCVFHLGDDGSAKPVTRWDRGGPVSWVAVDPRATDASASQPSRAAPAETFWIAAACERGTSSKASARVWQLPSASPEPVGELPHHQRVNRVTFSRDGRWIVTAAGQQSDEAGEAQLWKYVPPASRETSGEAWQLERQLNHQSGVAAAELSPCGKLLVTASYDGSGVLFDRSNGRWLASFRHKSSVWDARFSPDGRFVVTGSRDGTARVWDVATRNAAMPPMYHEGSVTHVHFDSASRQLLTVSRHTVRVWELATGNPHARLLKPTGEISRIALDRTGNYLIASARPRGNEPATCEVWRLTAGQPGRSLVRLSRQVACAAVDDSGTTMVTSDADGTTVCWEIGAGKASEKHKLLFAAENGDQQSAGSGSISVNHLAISEDGQLVAAGTGDASGVGGSVYVWKFQTGELVQRLRGCHEQGVLAVAFDRSGRRLVTGSADDSAQVWELTTGKPVGGRLQHTADVGCVAFSRDDASRYVVSASFDRTAIVWDTTGGRKLATVRLDGYVTDVRFHPTQPRYLVTTSSDGVARVWFLASRSDPNGSSTEAGLLFPKIVATLEHGDQLQQAAFDDAGDQVVTAGYYLPRLLGESSTTPAASQRVIRIGTWNMSATLSDADQAASLGALQSSRFLNEKGQDIDFLAASDLGRLWQQHHEQYRSLLAPAALVQSPQVLAAECEQASQWFAASWYLGKLLEKNPQDVDLLVRRATAYAELEDWQAAACDAQDAVNQGSTHVYSVLALSQLAGRDQAGYARTCEKIWQEIRLANDQFTRNELLWDLALAPNETFQSNTEEILRVAEQMVDLARDQRSDPYALAEHRCLNTLGAVYYRAEKHDQAIRTLMESEASYEQEQRERGLGSQADLQKGKIWNWLLLAMAHAQLGQQAEAEQQLSQVEEVFGKHQARDPQRYADALGTPSPPWYLRYSLRRLYDEAAAAVRPAAGG